MTVKEISDLTGVSVRALHYYDEIGLFTPAERSTAGYRLYDNGSLEILIQILFFREFGIPLNKIKAIINEATFDRKNSLLIQKKALIAKKDYMECLISSIDNILNGITLKTDLLIETKTKMNEVFQTFLINAPENIKQLI